VATPRLSPLNFLPILSPVSTRRKSACAAFGRAVCCAVRFWRLKWARYRVFWWHESSTLGITNCVDRAIGETMQAEYGPAVGSQRVGECQAEKGLMCISESGARQYNRRRRSCRDMSLYRPDEVQYMRPDWRLDLDRWLGSFGDYGRWKTNMTGWRWQHAEDMRALNEWAAAHAQVARPDPN
jgi:hypothetical protein